MLKFYVEVMTYDKEVCKIKLGKVVLLHSGMSGCNSVLFVW